MSHLDEPVDRASVLLSARLTVGAHDGDDARGCQCCTPDDCRQDRWARQVLADQVQPCGR